MADEPGPYRPPAEAFRQGYEPNVRWGYQCLTCNDEWYVPDQGHAEAGAKVHNDLHARERDARVGSGSAQ